MNKLILGTAQFGSDYGIKHDGQPSIPEIEKIAKVAWDGGIRIIHTSWQYGCSKIINTVFNEFEKIEKDREDLNKFWWGKTIGYVFYSPYFTFPIGPIDYMQFPVNILDKRCLNVADFFHKSGIEIHARSIFLQGLLLMDDLRPLLSWLPEELRKRIEEFHFVCECNNLQYHEAALGYVLGLEEIDKIIIGVNSAHQLEQLLQVKPLKWDYDFTITDENVLDPRRWPKE